MTCKASRGRGELGLLGKAWRKITGLFEEADRPQRRRRGLGRLVRLEDRALLSASAIDPQIQEALASSKPAQAQPEQMITRHEVAFVDSAVAEFDSLIAQLNRQDSSRQLDVVVLDRNQDGIQQITMALAGYQNLDAVHFLSHGRDGAVKLGSTWLDGGNIGANASFIETWKASLNADADLLFYGCDLAMSAQGESLLQTLGNLTGADVAASANQTGHTQMGGDWNLEFSTGTIGSTVALDAAAQEAWMGLLAPSTSGTAVWRDGGTSTPQGNDWDGVGFGTEGNTANVGEWRIIQGADAPTREEMILVGVSSSNVIRGQIYSGGVWSSIPLNNLATTSFSNRWTFDVTYESQSGDAILVWANGTTGSAPISYSVWNGTSWSAVQTITTPLSGEPTAVGLTANPFSDEIIVVATSTGMGDYVVVWNGSSWSNSATISTVASSTRDSAAAYEYLSGQGLAVADDQGGGTDLVYSTWNGLSWSAITGLAAPAGITGDPNFTILASDPTSDRIVLTVTTGDDEVWYAIWDGSSWGSTLVATSSAASGTTLVSAAAFESSSGDLLVTYAESASNIVKYRTWTSGGGWSAEMNGPDLGAVANSMTLDSDPYSNAIMLSVQDSASDLNYVLWNGSSWGTPSEQETSTNETSAQPFVFLFDHGPVVSDVNSLWLSTVGDVTSSGAPGMSSWTEGAVLRFSDPNLAFDPATTSGTLNQRFNLDWFAADGDADVDGMHYVSRDMTVGTNNFQLFAGDILLSTRQDETLTSLNSLVVDDNDMIVFRPGSAGDYSSGTFFMLIDVSDIGIDEIHDFALIEQNTVVGGTTLNAGTFVLLQDPNDADSDGGADNQINQFTPGALGDATTAGTLTLLIDGVDIGISGEVDGLEVVQKTRTIGGVTLTAGQILLSLEGADGTVGDNSIAVTEYDIIILNVTATGSSTAATATLWFDGSDVGFASSAQNIDAIALICSNSAPTAVNNSYSTNEDVTLNVAAPGVLGNDTDPDGDTLTTVLVSTTSNGSLTLNANGSFSYTPNANWSGVDSFTCRASDGSLTSNLVTVTITVNAVNDAPVGNNDSYSVNEDNTLNVGAPGVLGNDTDVEGSALTAVLVSTTTNGTLTLNANGSFSYTPNANFNGVDTFTYRANDGSTNGNLATVTITVNAVNDAPVGVADNYSVNEDNTLNVAASGVLGNDTDVEGSALTAVLVSTTTNGSLTLNANGSFSYTPNANFSGVDSFTYTANDGSLNSNVTTVTITVNPVNDAPVGVVESYSTNEDTPLVVSVPGVLANDTDVEGTSLTAVLVTGAANGSLVLSPNGSFTYTPNLNFVGSDSFVYQANDGAANSNPVTVTITVGPVNDAPVGVADSYSVNEDNTLNVAAAGVLGNDIDVDGDALIGLLVSSTSNGSLTFNNDGSFAYTPNANFNGVDSFTYRASDSALTSNVTTVTLTVNAVNDAPVAVADSYSTNEDVTLVVVVPGVLGNDTDVDGNPLTAVLVAGPTNGSLTLNANGSFSYSSNLNYNGVDSFSYRANDGIANSNVVTITITIDAINDAPVAGGNSYSVNEDTTLTIPAAGVLGNNFDVEADVLTAILVTGPSSGVISFAADGSFTFTPNQDFNGADSFTYKSNDGAADSNIATVTLTINAVNDAPVRIAGSIDEMTVMQASGLTPLGLEDLQYSPGGGPDEAGQTISFIITEVPDVTVGEIVLADGVTVVTFGSSYTLDELHGMQFRTAGGVGGPLAFGFIVQDSGGSGNGGVNFIAEATSVVVQPLPPMQTAPVAPPIPGTEPIDMIDASPPDTDYESVDDDGQYDEDPHTIPVPQELDFVVEVAAVPGKRALAEDGGKQPLKLPSDPRFVTAFGDMLPPFEVFDNFYDENGLATITATHLGVGISSRTPSFMLNPQFFWNQLNELAQQFEPETWSRLANVTFLTGLTMSAGYLFWNMRTWYLLASLLLSRPLWQEFDHMAVLDVWYKNPKTRRYLLGFEDDDEEEKALGGVVE